VTKQEPWFVEERARWFASLVLTKHNDVKVQPYAGTGKGIDLLVEALESGQPTLRLFGVQVKAYLDLPDVQKDEQSNSRPGGGSFEVGLPLCVFAIGARKPEGIYRWIVGPVVEDGRALLRRDVEANWQALDEAGAARLIGQVNAWYDALNGGTTPKRRGRHSKKEA
jgi:hypothetical protein